MKLVLYYIITSLSKKSVTFLKYLHYKDKIAKLVLCKVNSKLLSNGYFTFNLAKVIHN